MKILKMLIISGWIMTVSYSIRAQISIGSYNVYYGHLHNHCSYSDGNGTADAAYNYAKNTSKLDFFSLADHNLLLSSTEWNNIKTAANKYQSDGVFTALWGFEWTTLTYGHATVIGSSSYNLTALTFSNFVSWLNGQNCVAFFNHPGYSAGNSEFNHFSSTPTDKLVGIELWNGSDGFSKYYYNDGYYAGDGKSYFDEALARGWKIGAAGSEDNHSTNWGNSSNSRLAILATANNRTELMAALQAKRFFSTLDKNLALSFKINGSEMGSTIKGGFFGLQIQAKDGDGETFSEVTLLKNGAVVNTWPISTNLVNISTNMFFTDGEYYYVKVKQADGGEAISSPIWIKGQTGNIPPVVSITSPVSGTGYTEPASVIITASASDQDGTVAKVDLYQGTTLLQTLTAAPFTYTWSNVAAGNYSLTAVATDNSGATTTSTAVTLTVASTQTLITFNTRVAASMDDVEETSTGIIYTNSDDLELVYDSWLTGNQVVGIRFNGITIPKGAVITKASIQFTVDEVTTSSVSLVIKGQSTDNAAAFTTGSKNVSSRTKTTAFVSWVPAGWTAAGLAGAAQLTPDLKGIVQEIVSRTGWSSGNSMVFIITGSGKRTAKAYDVSPSQGPLLTVEYSVSGATLKSAEVAGNFVSNAIEEKGELMCYPVPVKDMLNIRFNPGENENLTRIELYSATGSKIRVIETTENLITIPMNDLQSGMYLIRAISDKTIYSQTLVKN